MFFEVTESLKRSNWPQIHQCCRGHGLIHFTRAAIFVSTHTTGLRYFVYFHSVIENIDRRKTLRQTWVNVEWHNGKVTFFCSSWESQSRTGTSTKTDYTKAHGDIVFGDFLDVYGLKHHIESPICTQPDIKELWVDAIRNQSSRERFFMNIFKLTDILDKTDLSSTTIHVACSVNRKKAMGKTASWRK